LYIKQYLIANTNLHIIFYASACKLTEKGMQNNNTFMSVLVVCHAPAKPVLVGQKLLAEKDRTN
jgi:hypothetical protein